MHTHIDYCPISQITSPICHVASPYSGRVLPLTSHPDAIFSLGILGSGVCVEITGELVVAPFNGHIIAIKQGGVEWILESFDKQRVLLNIALPPQLQTPEYLKLLLIEKKPINRGDPLVRLPLMHHQKPIAAFVLLDSPKNHRYFFPLKQVQAGVDPLITIAEE